MYEIISALTQSAIVLDVEVLELIDEDSVKNKSLAVEETGYSAADVARYLGVKRMSVHEAVTRGKTLCADYTSLGLERK